MKVTVQRPWHGKASVRDYLVLEAVNRREDLEIKIGAERMFVPFADLNKGITNKEIFTSKHNNKTYRLVDFDWKPDDSQKRLWG